MALSLRVPTIFTARDGVSATLRRMGQGVQSFANRVQSGVSRGNSLFKKLTPSIGEAGKQLLSFASAATIASAAFGLGSFTKDSLIEYETSVAQFRTIVSDLNDTDFAKFEKAIGKVATDTKKSTIDVAKSFEMIAGLNSKFAETEQSLSAVSSAAITLSKASGDTLEASATNLVGIMNQFNLKAEESNRVINVLAAGQAVGAASITESAESYKNFGSVASSSNITLEQSIGLIQTLAARQVKGSEAGTALRGVTLKLQKAGMGYKSGQFQINDALDQTNKIYSKMKTSKEKDLFLIKIFGAENISAGKILLNNIPLYQDFTKSVTGTSEAQKASAINSDTLKNRLDEVKASWVNLVTTSDDSKKSLDSAKDALKFVSDNLGEIVLWTGRVVGGLLAFKATLLIVEGVMAIYSVGLGIMAAVTGSSSVALGTNTIALNAWYISMVIGQKALWLWNAGAKAVTAAQWLWNVAMTANPIGLIIVGIAALIGIIASIIYYWDEWGSTVIQFLGPLGMVIDFIMSIKANWDMVKKAFKDGGILGGLKAIGRVLLDVLLKPIQNLLGLLAKIPGLSALAKTGIDRIQTVRDGLNVSNSGSEPLYAPQTQAPITMGNGAYNPNGPFALTKNTVDVNILDPNNRTKVNGLGSKNNVTVTKTSGQR